MEVCLLLELLPQLFGLNFETKCAALPVHEFGLDSVSDLGRGPKSSSERNPEYKRFSLMVSFPVK